MLITLCAAAFLAGPGDVRAEASPAFLIEGLPGAGTLRMDIDLTPWAIPRPEMAGAPAQEEDFTRRTWREHGPFSEGYYLFAGFLVRQTMIQGDWYDNGLEDDDYGDLFKEGTGFAVELGAMIPYREDWRVGLYLSGGWDTYEGDSIDTGLGTLEPDEMSILTGLIGFRGMLHFAEILFWEAHAAAGVVYYQAVDATQGGVEFELFESTLGGALEIGTRVGIELVIVQFEVGVAYRLQTGPGRGEDVTHEVDPDLMHCILIELGGAIRF